MISVSSRRRRKRRERWESYCNRCGLCCYRKDVRKGRVHINMRAPCQYLDTKINQCTVYDQRLKVCRGCSRVRLYHVLFTGIMPKDCGYVERYRKWRMPMRYPKISRRSEES